MLIYDLRNVSYNKNFKKTPTNVSKTHLHSTLHIQIPKIPAILHKVQISVQLPRAQTLQRVLSTKNQSFIGLIYAKHLSSLCAPFINALSSLSRYVSAQF